jgi:hypothetical protein
MALQDVVTLCFVIPAEAGIQKKHAILDPGLRRGDGSDSFLRGYPFWISGLFRVSDFVLRIWQGL